MFASQTNIDELELSDMFRENIALDEKQPKYADVEWIALDDRNAKTYGNALIKFDTTELKDRLPIYRES
jgi:hypothetical protein